MTIKIVLYLQGMRFILFIVCSCFLGILQAQTDVAKVSKSPRASVALQYTSETINESPTTDNLALFGEVFIKPRMSVWASFRLRRFDTYLLFQLDTVIGPGITLVRQPVLFKNAQSLITSRVGVRFYSPTRFEQWSFLFSNFVGYTQLSRGDKDFQAALQRDDLEPFFKSYYEEVGLNSSWLELGGEVGTRWSFLNKFYFEGSTLLYLKHSIGYDPNTWLRDENTLNFNLRMAIGFKF